MAELAGGSGGVSFGSLYPALNRLELAGAVRMIDHARPRLVGPMTGAISGELAALRHQRKSATSEQKSGRRILEPVARLGLFERRRAHLTTELAKRRQPSDAPTTDPYLRSLKERDITTLTDDLGWLDELTRITQEQLLPAVPQPVVTPTGGTHP
jgi:DNA-binding PadR family transcriptional regulator